MTTSSKFGMSTSRVRGGKRDLIIASRVKKKAVRYWRSIIVIDYGLNWRDEMIMKAMAKTVLKQHGAK